MELKKQVADMYLSGKYSQADIARQLNFTRSYINLILLETLGKKEMNEIKKLRAKINFNKYKPKILRYD